VTDVACFSYKDLVSGEWKGKEGRLDGYCNCNQCAQSNTTIVDGDVLTCPKETEFCFLPNRSGWVGGGGLTQRRHGSSRVMQRPMHDFSDDRRLRYVYYTKYEKLELAEAYS
jgi:hypothetical protein